MSDTRKLRVDGVYLEVTVAITFLGQEIPLVRYREVRVIEDVE